LQPLVYPDQQLNLLVAVAAHQIWAHHYMMCGRCMVERHSMGSPRSAASQVCVHLAAWGTQLICSERFSPLLLLCGCQHRQRVRWVTTILNVTCSPRTQ
jgi:hypothetical protein